MELLLSDPRLNSSEDKQVALISCVRSGSVEMTKLILRDPRIEPSERDLIESAQGYNPKLLSLLLTYSEVVSPNKLLEEACMHNRPGNVKILIPLCNLTWKRYSIFKIVKRPEMINILLSDKRVDLDDLIQHINYKKLAVSSQRVGVLWSCKNEVWPDYFKSFARLLILRRPSYTECLDWFLEHPTRDTVSAAQHFITGRHDRDSPMHTVTYGFLLLGIIDNTLETIIEQLREEESSKTGIRLARAVVSIFLERFSDRVRDYDILIELLMR